ncbi:MAG: permease [Proteobacteria bacterium]|nr:permease [Pseudomonadota bacterium]
MIHSLLLAALAIGTVLFAVAVFQAWRKAPVGPSLEGMAMSAVSNFFDTLGISSFASTTAYLKFRKLVPDELIPCTMMVGYGLPATTQAFIFLNVVKIDPLLLGLGIAASVVGGLVGVSVAAWLPVRPIRLVMGIGLLVAAASFAASALHLMPLGGTATSLAPLPFALVVAASFVLGVLVNLGVGNFAPTLVLVSLLGMDPRAAFPLMMGSAALLVLVAGVRIVRARPLDMALVLGMILGGIPAVLVAAFIVKSLPIEQLRWGVIAVVTYAAAVMLHAALAPRPIAVAEEAAG